MSNAVAIDVIPSNVHRYAQYNPIAQFKQISSASDAFKNYVASTHFDVVFIDGDHEYQPVSDDFDAVKDCAQVVVFHDIDNVACPGVARKWTEVRRDYQQTYEFFEFTDQYEEVLRRTPQRSHYLGMGVAMRKAFHQSHGAVRDFSATRADNQNEVVV
jgi:predicted O-methyltransferase YrrM